MIDIYGTKIWHHYRPLCMAFATFLLHSLAFAADSLALTLLGKTPLSISTQTSMDFAYAFRKLLNLAVEAWIFECLDYLYEASPSASCDYCQALLSGYIYLLYV